MITKEQARDKVTAKIATYGRASTGDEWIILDDHTIERSFGWIFFYTSRLWHETGRLEYAVAGNAPLLVDRVTGELHETGTAHPIETYIRAYEQTGSTRA
jgi:hypothetical protein